MNTPSSVCVILPEILDLRYRDILTMFKQSIEHSGATKVIIDFSENNKLMESGWVVLSSFIQFLEKHDCRYQFINVDKPIPSNLAAAQNTHNVVALNRADKPPKT